MIDEEHPHATGTRHGNQDMSRTKGHLTVDAHDMPVRIIITAGSCSDISQAFPLVEGMNAGSSSRIKPIAVHRLREQL